MSGSSAPGKFVPKRSSSAPCLHVKLQLKERSWRIYGLSKLRWRQIPFLSSTDGLIWSDGQRSLRLIVLWRADVVFIVLYIWVYVMFCVCQAWGSWWICCWTRCRCWGTCCCCASSSSSSSASSACSSGLDFCATAAIRRRTSPCESWLLFNMI